MFWFIVTFYGLLMSFALGVLLGTSDYLLEWNTKRDIHRQQIEQTAGRLQCGDLAFVDPSEDPSSVVGKPVEITNMPLPLVKYGMIQKLLRAELACSLRSQ